MVNNNVKDILSCTEDDIKALQEEHVRILKSSLRFDTLNKLIFGISLYLNILAAYNKNRKVDNVLFAIALAIRIVAGLVLEKLATNTEDVDRLKKLKNIDRVVLKVVAALAMAAIVSFIFNMK